MAGISTWQQMAADPDNPTESQLTLLPRNRVAPLNSLYGVVFSHGASLTTVATDPAFPAQALQCPAWSSAGLYGYSVIARSFNGNNWANDTGIGRMDQTYAWHQNQGAKPGKIVLLAFSMGALLALNYTVRNPSKVACCVLMCPVLSLITVHDSNQGGYQPSIESAYGGLSAYSATVATRDPLTFASTITTPLKVYYSTNDMFCTPAYVATLTGASSSSVDSVSMGASGHTMAPVNGDDAMAFIAAHT